MKNTIYILCTIAFMACDTGSSNDFITETTVVDAYLFANQHIDSLRVTKSNSYSDTGDVVTIDQLSINISDGNQTFTLQSIGNGYYESADFIIQNETSYELSFEYNGQTIRSNTYIPAKKEAAISTEEIFVEKIQLGQFPSGEQPDPVEINWNNDEGDYYYVVINNMEENPEYINEFLASGNFPRPFRFITEPSIMNTYNINTRRDIQQFGTHQIIIYRVNPEYAALYATSGSTSTTISQPPTNIENGLGIFTGVSSDTVYLEVKEL